MTDTRSGHGDGPVPEQPGLEVVSSDNYPEVSALNSSGRIRSVLPEVHRDDQAPEKAPDVAGLHAVLSPTEAAPKAAPGPPVKKSRKKRIIIPVALLVVVVVVGAVVGGVVGTRAARSDQKAPSETKSVADPRGAAMTGSITSVAPGLAPTAVSFGHPHFEVFAFGSKRGGIYYQTRPANATSEWSFPRNPRNNTKVLVEGLPGDAVQSLAVGTRRLSTSRNWTEVHITNGSQAIVTGRSGSGQTWYPSPDDEDQEQDPMKWKTFPGEFLSAAAVAGDSATRDGLKTFAVGAKDTDKRPTIYYYSLGHQEFRVSSISIDSITGGPEVQKWAPAAVSRPDGGFEVFAVSARENHLLHWSRAKGRTTWGVAEDLGGFLTMPPVVVSRANGALDVFGIGADGYLYHQGRNGTDAAWQGWTLVSGLTRVRGLPSALSAYPDRVDVFAWGEQKNYLLHKTYDAATGTWRGGETYDAVLLLDNDLTGPPTALADGSGDMHIFAHGLQDTVFWMTLGPDGEVKRRAETIMYVWEPRTDEEMLWGYGGQPDR